MGPGTVAAAEGTALLSLKLIARAESFLVTKDNQLEPGEEDRAQEWGEQLAARMLVATPSG
jgi:hypothetical protein